MVPWIFIHARFEQRMADYKRIFDAWEDGGVRGIAVGRMFFVQEDGSYIPTFPADPKVYESYGVGPPLEAPRDREKEKVFHAMLDDAASRGWHIMIFDVPLGGGSRPPEEDPYCAVRFAAGAQDLMNAYPQAHGIIMDGPGRDVNGPELPYELAWHHAGELFEIREYERSRYQHLGVDIDRLERGIAHLRDRFHNLTPDLVRYHAPGGMLAGLTLFDLNEDALYWLRTRQETALGFMAAMRTQIDKLNRKVELGGIPRTATFSSLTGQNYQQMGKYFDYIFPKHYYWHRGFDGMYGTIQRWVQKFSEWNPTLTEEDCFALVKSLFGIKLPGVHSLMDMEMGFPEEFFSEVVYSETRRALEAIGDDDKVICWVSTARRPHAGDAMTARDLDGILRASERAGLKRFLFHPEPDLGAAEWSVISGMCGNLWRQDPDGYWPSNTPKPDEFTR